MSDSLCEIMSGKILLLHQPKLYINGYFFVLVHCCLSVRLKYFLARIDIKMHFTLLDTKVKKCVSNANATTGTLTMQLPLQQQCHSQYKT